MLHSLTGIIINDILDLPVKHGMCILGTYLVQTCNTKKYYLISQVKNQSEWKVML